MVASTITAEQCAGLVMENIPPAMRFIRAEMRRQGAPGFSMPQFRALAFLDHNPGASLSAVADHLGVTLATASTIADRLVRHGLVERAAHPRERRRITLTLTDAGQGLLRDARAATRSKVATVLETLSADELRQIAAGATLLGAAFRNVPAEPKRNEIDDR